MAHHPFFSLAPKELENQPEVPLVHRRAFTAPLSSFDSDGDKYVSSPPLALPLPRSGPRPFFVSDMAEQLSSTAIDGDSECDMLVKAQSEVSSGFLYGAR